MYCILIGLANNNEARYTKNDTLANVLMYSNEHFSKRKTKRKRIKQSKSIRGEQIECIQFILTLALLLLNGLQLVTGVVTQYEIQF